MEIQSFKTSHFTKLITIYFRPFHLSLLKQLNDYDIYYKSNNGYKYAYMLLQIAFQIRSGFIAHKAS